MIKLASRNINFLNFILRIPILKHFFTLKVGEDFGEISNDRVLSKFYTDIYVNNKTSKKTSKNRFSDLDTLCYKYLEKNKLLMIHDVAVSNGISSCELHELLNNQGFSFRLFISDKYAKINAKTGFISKFYDSENQFTFGYLGPFFGVKKNIFFPLTIALFHLLKKIKNNEKYNLSIQLFHPKLLEKINNHAIKYIEYDIFETKTELKFNFIRCMNILNLGYFDKDLIIKGVQNIVKSLKEDGYLLIGRTNSNGQNNATFFRKQNSQVIAIEDLNDGSEIKQLISGINFKS
jgi:hypothetical protein